MSYNGVTQKAICFKISLRNLDGIDDWVRNCTRWTNRNAELNRAVEMYLEYIKAKESYNYEGDPCKMKEWLEHYVHRAPASLFQ